MQYVDEKGLSYLLKLKSAQIPSKSLFNKSKKKFVFSPSATMICFKLIINFNKY